MNIGQGLLIQLTGLCLNALVYSGDDFGEGDNIKVS